ncbi:hypothetical protein PoB_006383600 [Plakobranchus ocellatus]|uniref:Uncharacterized protein n=1 Tax=Plakobranchus ocellatus TaxID=259542 RepID=A0AAV4CZG4_9GAST|nr:hypothetical protein PoB_006383600 [Plakobranchus ocellatus]
MPARRIGGVYKGESPSWPEESRQRGALIPIGLLISLPQCKLVLDLCGPVNTRRESVVVNVKESLSLTNTQRSRFKCKRYSRDCTYMGTSAKKAGAGVIATAPGVGATRDSVESAGPALEVMNNVQSENKDDMLRRASGKAVLVVANCAGRFKKGEGSLCAHPERENRRSRSGRDEGYRKMLLKRLVEENHMTHESFFVDKNRQYGASS